MKRFCLGLVAFAFVCMSFVWAQSASEFKGHDGLVHSVAVSPDGTVLATAGVDGLIKIWDFSSGKEKFVLKGHTGTVNSVAFSKDGSILASGGADKGIRIWNAKEGKAVKEFAKGHTDAVSAVAFSPDGKLLASAGVDKTVRLWDVDGKELKNLGSHKDSVYSVAFSNDGTKLVSSGNDGYIKVWDVKAMNEIKTMMVDLPKKEVVVKKEEPKDKDKDKDKKPKKDGGKKEEPKELRDAFLGVAFTADGKSVLSVGHDKYLRYWSLADGKELKKLGPTPDWIFGLALSKDGKYAATAGYGGSIRVYEVESGKQIYPDADKDKTKAADDARRGWITYSITFAPDGKSVITGSEKAGKGIAKVIPIGK